ncbi:MAG: protein kinase family protein [Alphaproteobacteria bacterium]|nr:protein kinase family protein [Alphaproteobacteria bacterium]
MKSRIRKYDHISKILDTLSDERLTKLIDKAAFNHSGIGGQSAYLTIDGTNVFVKKIPLTDLERIDENVRSTANLFGLPLYYQYGVGSAGFGAWRELTAHIMTTDWVLTEKCPNFPLLYNWRVLENTRLPSMDAKQIEKLEHDVRYWNDSLAIRKRLEALHNASAYVLLFLEYVPSTLYKWLSSEFAKGDEKVGMAISFVESELAITNSFFKSQNFIHFDAHFENLLTDGKSVYFSDFGLSLSRTFDLSNEEIEFFNNHIHYDESCVAVNLLHCLVTSLKGEDKWPLVLQQFLKEEDNTLNPAFLSMINRYGSIALAMDEFFTKLQNEDKETPYPKDSLEHMLIL